MNAEAEIFLNLLCISIGTKVNLPRFEGVVWPVVMQLSQTQGVRGLAFEALEQLKKNGAGDGILPDKPLFMQWYAQTVFVEKMYQRHLSRANEIASLWGQNGLKVIVFKGLAHSRYYPNPAHREFGDLDCFLIGKDGKPAYAEGNEIARKNGLSVDDSWYKHSHITYKGLTIENHQYFTPARRGGGDKALNEYLLESIGNGDGLEKLQGTSLYCLPVDSEGLFLLSHAMTHFLVEGIRLRHFVDWACWMKANQDRINWNDFYTNCKSFRLDGFADVANTIVVKFFGMEFHDKSIFANSPYAEKTIENALYGDSSIYNKGKGRWSERYNVIKNAFVYHWKYKQVARLGMAGYIWQFVYGFLRRGENE